MIKIKKRVSYRPNSRVSFLTFRGLLDSTHHSTHPPLPKGVQELCEAFDKTPYDNSVVATLNAYPYIVNGEIPESFRCSTFIISALQHLNKVPENFRERFKNEVDVTIKWVCEKKNSNSKLHNNDDFHLWSFETSCFRDVIGYDIQEDLEISPDSSLPDLSILLLEDHEYPELIIHTALYYQGYVLEASEGGLTLPDGHSRAKVSGVWASPFKDWVRDRMRNSGNLDHLYVMFPPREKDKRG